MFKVVRFFSDRYRHTLEGNTMFAVVAKRLQFS